MVEFLIDYGISIDEENISGETLLICAAQHGHTEICEFLLNYGVYVNKKNHLEKFLAACYGKTEICKLLVEYGVDRYLFNIVEEEMKNNILTWREAFGKK